MVRGRRGVVIYLPSVLLVAASLTACGGGGGAASSSPGGMIVSGRITLGPFCPAESPASPCPTPAEAFSGEEATARSGDQELRFAATLTGDVEMNLPPGTWEVSATAGMSCESVTVSRAQQITIACDTGIR